MTCMVNVFVEGQKEPSLELPATDFSPDIIVEEGRMLVQEGLDYSINATLLPGLLFLLFLLLMHAALSLWQLGVRLSKAAGLCRRTDQRWLGHILRHLLLSRARAGAVKGQRWRQLEPVYAISRLYNYEIVKRANNIISCRAASSCSYGSSLMIRRSLSMLLPMMTATTSGP